MSATQAAPTTPDTNRALLVSRAIRALEDMAEIGTIHDASFRAYVLHLTREAVNAHRAP